MSAYTELVIACDLKNNEETRTLAMCLGRSLDGEYHDVFDIGNVQLLQNMNHDYTYSEISCDALLYKILSSDRFSYLGTADAGPSDLDNLLSITIEDDNIKIMLTAVINDRSFDLHENLIKFIQEHANGDKSRVLVRYENSGYCDDLFVDAESSPCSKLHEQVGDQWIVRTVPCHSAFEAVLDDDTY